MSMTEEINISNNDIYKALMNLTAQNQEIKDEIKSLKRELEAKTNQIQENYKELLEENKQLKIKIRLNERRARKNNIIIHGCQEDGNENVINTVLELINRKLGVELATHEINNAYRIGVRKGNTRIRPIRLELLSYQKRSNIITQANKLKGTNIYITDDLSPEDLQEHKLIVKHLIHARKNNIPAKIKNFKLIVNGEEFSYEDLRNTPLEQSEQKNEIDISTISPPPQRKNASLPSTPSTTEDVFSEIACSRGKEVERRDVPKITQLSKNTPLPIGEVVGRSTKKSSSGETIRSSERIAKFDKKH